MTRPRLTRRAIPAVLLCTAALVAAAQESAFKFRGFGTLAVAHSSEDKADFTSNFSQPSGPGFTRSLDFGVDSHLGLQVDLTLPAGFSAAVQVISERRYDKTFTPYLNMAHLKYQALPGLALRAGRMPFSAYLISDYQKVGYSTPWVRPPVEVYQFNPLTYFDGGDLLWKQQAGSVALSGQVLAGTTEAKVPLAGGTATFKGRDAVAANVTAEVGSATFRAFYLQMKGTVDSAALDGPAGPFALLRALPPAFGGNPALADRYQVKGDRITYASVGFNYDPGDWFLMAEAARNAGEENILLHATAGYLTAGYRIQAWTPYLTVAKKQTDSATTQANPIVAALIRGNDHAQSSVGLGVRWDFMASAALKLQADRLSLPAGSTGPFVNQQPSFRPGGSATLITATLDVVF